MPCVCSLIKRERERESPQQGGSGSGVECFTLPAKWTSLPVALKQAAGASYRPHTHNTLDTPVLWAPARLVVRGRWNLLSCGPRD